MRYWGAVNAADESLLSRLFVLSVFRRVIANSNPTHVVLDFLVIQPLEAIENSQHTLADSAGLVWRQVLVGCRREP